MSLKLKKTDTIRVRVHVTTPGSDPDRATEGSFVGEFKYLDRAQFDALVGRSPTDNEVLDEVLVGLDEVADASGAPLSFADAAAAIKSDLNYAGATVRTYFDALSGAAAKNSNRSRAR